MKERTTPSWRYWLFELGCKALKWPFLALAYAGHLWALALLVGVERREYLESYRYGKATTAAAMKNRPRSTAT